MCARVQTFLARLGVEHAGEVVLVVTHGITLRAFRYLLEGWTYDEMELNLRHHAPRNASVTVYQSSGERLRLTSVDEVFEPA